MNRFQVALLVTLSTTTFAGNRALTGGTLQVAMVSAGAAQNPLSADSPVDVFRLLLTHQLLCQLVEFSRPAPLLLRLTIPPSLDPGLVTEALQRVKTSTHPARGFLIPVSGWSLVGRNVELQLKGPAPDLERMLCHPAFAIALGPFRLKGTQFEAFDEQPAGRPHLDSVAIQSTDARAAERLLAQRRVQLVIGAASTEEPTQLFATALVLGPGLDTFRQALESIIDRNHMARFFVTAPSGPLAGLLPPSLGLAVESTPVKKKPTPLSPPRELVIRFDEEAVHEKSIAQRLQVKLQPLGYRLALKPTPREKLRGHQPGEGELFLQSVILPPSPIGALILWLGIAGQTDKIPLLLRATISDVNARANELSAELPLVPLVTRGLGVNVSQEVQNLKRDILGLPKLDDVFLAAE